MGWNNSLDNPRVTCGVRRFLLFANILVCARLFAQESKTSGFADLFRKPPKPTRRLGARSRCFCCLDPIPPTEGGGRENQPLGWVKPRPTPLPDQAATAAHTSSLVSNHTRVSHAHARPHCPTAPLAMVLAQSIVRARTRARGMGGLVRRTRGKNSKDAFVETLERNLGDGSAFCERGKTGGKYQESMTSTTTEDFIV